MVEVKMLRFSLGMTKMDRITNEISVGQHWLSGVEIQEADCQAKDKYR